MRRLFKKSSDKAGMSPGTLVLVGEHRSDAVRIRLTDYDRHRLDEREPAAIEDTFPVRDSPTVSWISVDGLHDLELIGKLGGHFGIHPLVLEDILHTGQRPKLEEFEDYLFLVMKVLRFDPQDGRVRSEQLSLVVGSNYVISFQESDVSVLEPVRARIRRGTGRLRNGGCGYLAYAIMDAVVDHYFAVLEAVGERIEEIEDELLSDARAETMQQIHHLKREMIHFRRQVWPLREVVGMLRRSDSPLVDAGTGIFFADIHDHIVQVGDTVETFRDLLSGLLDLYLTTVSHRMNEVMKVLTIMATLFIPLTFIAGIYGMNFKGMPELEWRYGYPAAWALMAAVALGMIVYFKRRRWF